MPIVENRAYRKNLTSQGLLYLGYQEHPIKIVNLSLTGLLAELVDSPPVNGIKDIFNALQVSPIVDIYLPEMRVVGEAEVVRAEASDHGFQIAIEFRHLSYDADNLLYSRRAYRKSMTAPGHIVLDGVDYAFSTENVSVDGLMIRMLGVVKVREGSIADFDFKHLDLRGQAKVIWVEYDEFSTLIGLQYQHLARGDFTGIPNFSVAGLQAAG